MPLPHDRLGETACACVVPTRGAAVPSVRELGAHLGERGVAKQFFPESICTCDDLPRTPSGKIQKFVLRDLVLAEARHRKPPAGLTG